MTSASGYDREVYSRPRLLPRATKNKISQKNKTKYKSVVGTRRGRYVLRVQGPREGELSAVTWWPTAHYPFSHQNFSSMGWQAWGLGWGRPLSSQKPTELSAIPRHWGDRRGEVQRPERREVQKSQINHSICFLPRPSRCLPIVNSPGLQTKKPNKESEMQFIRDLYAREIKIGVLDPHRKTRFDKFSRLLAGQAIA